MEVIKIILNNIPSINIDTLILGYFDAFHLGHVALVNKGKQISNNIGLMTFDKNPKSVLLNKDVEEINSLEERINIASLLGIDKFIILEINQDIFSLSKDDFINMIIDKINPKNIVVGYDYTYGKNKQGNVLTLKELNKYNIYEVKPVLNGSGIKISSTYIKYLISQGEIAKANSYLYQDFQIKGTVIEGNKIGRTIDFKTANIDPNNKYVLPKNGVYAGICVIDNQKYKCMMNVGNHPTINKLNHNIIEVHILNFSQDIYGKEINVIFKTKLRDEKKFNSLDDLKKELSKNKIQTDELIKL
jgi:riboflavin kinase / FMN adenylyltransferase